MADIHLTTTSYPTAIDTATTLRDDVTAGDGTGDIIQAIHQNGPASAIIAIETALGVNPFGSAADVASRLNTGLNPNGTLKVSGGTVAPNRLLFGGTAGAIESNPTILVDPVTGQLQLDTQGSAGGLRIGLDTLLYRSGVDQLRTPDSLQIDASLTVLGGLVTPTGGGTANQLLGNNAGGTALEYKTLQGTANQITVTHSAGSITLSAPQDLHTGASPQFVGMFLSGSSGHTLRVERNATTLGEAIKIYKSSGDAAQAWLTWSQGAELSGVWRVGFTGAPYDLRFCVGSATDLGTEVLRLTTDGRVGIGTSTPTNLLTVGVPEATIAFDPKIGVYGSAGASIVVRDTLNDVEGILAVSSEGVAVGAMSTHNLLLRTNNTNVVRIENAAPANALVIKATNGNVGIGTTTPGAKLDVNGSIRNQTSANSFANGYTAAFGKTRVLDPSNPQFELWHDGVRVGQFSFANGTLHYGTHLGSGAQTTYLTILDGGNIGIGHTNPPRRLTVNGHIGFTSAGTGQGIFFPRESGDPFYFLVGQAFGEATDDSFALINGSSGAQYLLISQTGPRVSFPSGNVGFGTQTQFGGGSGVIGLANATTAPTMNPTGGIVLYAEDGRLTYRSPRGEFVKLDMTATLSVGYHLQRGRLFL
jgi:hypothetical protein